MVLNMRRRGQKYILGVWKGKKTRGKDWIGHKNLWQYYCAEEQWAGSGEFSGVTGIFCMELSRTLNNLNGCKIKRSTKYIIHKLYRKECVQTIWKICTRFFPSLSPAFQASTSLSTVPFILSLLLYLTSDLDKLYFSELFSFFSNFLVLTEFLHSAFFWCQVQNLHNDLPIHVMHIWFSQFFSFFFFLIYLLFSYNEYTAGFQGSCNFRVVKTN